MSLRELFIENVFCNELLTPERRAISVEFGVFDFKWRLVTRLLGLPLPGSTPVSLRKIGERKKVGGIKLSLSVSIHGATTNAEPVPCTEGIPRRTWPSDNAPRDQ